MEKITKDHNLSQSEIIVETNIDKLKALFPEIVTEGKIDFKVLQEVLGSELEEDEEYYRFTWAGKANARREAQKPSTGTLRPAPEESVDWDTTENLYIEGDNLEVLKLLQKGYAGKVNMIYIDPPYNTGSDFVYKDNYKDNLRNYQNITGQIDEEGNKLSTNSDSDGRYHSNWLNMIYPRLKLARNLLNEEGVVFMSIDDNEIINLKKACDEVFGEDNFVAQLVWEKKKKGAFLAGGIVNIKEYVLAYSKNKSKFTGLIGEISRNTETYPVIKTTNARGTRLIKKGVPSKYKEEDHTLKKGSRISSGNMELILLSDLIIKNGVLEKDLLIDSNWIYSQDSINKYVDDGDLYITQDLYLRRIVREPREKKIKDILPRVGTEGISGDRFILDDNLFKDGWGTNEDGNNELHQLLGIQNLFDFPKPSKLISKLIHSIKDKNITVLDFFSGSGTTAQAVLEINAQDSGNRKYIQVQLPELTEKDSPVNRAGYQTIAEIGKERIRRAAQNIEKKNSKKAQNLDLGFKVFKLDTSNIKGWDGNPDNLDESLFDTQDNIKTDRTEHDVLYEILLKYGLDLTLPIEEKHISTALDGTKKVRVFSVGYGALFICLADNITNVVAQGIGEWKEELQPEVCRVVFKDSGFTDVEKTNSIQTLKRFGITEIKSI